jgi:hypothetical protein
MGYTIISNDTNPIVVYCDIKKAKPNDIMLHASHQNTAVLTRPPVAIINHHNTTTLDSVLAAHGHIMYTFLQSWALASHPP